MRASQEVSIDAPAAALWELIGEPSLYPRFLRDVTRWEKIAGDEGSRPRYHIEVRVGGVELGAVVEITHASAPHELGWESVSGIEHHGHWRVRSDGDRRCTVAASRLSAERAATVPKEHSSKPPDGSLTRILSVGCGSARLVRSDRRVSS